MSVDYKIQKVNDGYIVFYIDKKGRPMAQFNIKASTNYERAKALNEFCRNPARKAASA